MLRQFVLQPNEDKRLQIEGRYLVVTQATGPIELSIGGTTPITVDQNDRIHLRNDSPNDRAVRLKNVSGGVNTIELHTSDLLIDKRTGVDVTNAIVIAEDQRIGIDPQANIVQAVIQNPVRIDPQGNTITIAKGQCVGIDPKKNSVKATLTHPVEIEDNQLIGINPAKNTVNVIRKGKLYRAMPTLTFTAPQGSPPDTVIEHTIAPNAIRDVLILTASTDNAQPVWLGGTEGQGTPVFPGDRLFVEGNHGLTLAAKTDHTLYVAEVILKDLP